MAVVKTIHLPQMPRSMKVVNFGEAMILMAESNQREQAAYQRGYDTAVNELNNQILDARKEMNYAQDYFFGEIQKRFEAVLKEIGARIPGLTMMIARKALGSVTFDAANMQRIVEQALEEVSQREGAITVELSKADYELLEKFDGEWLKKYPNIKFECSEALSFGDCRLKTGFGTVNATLEGKLRNIEQSFVTG